MSKKKSQKDRPWKKKEASENEGQIKRLLLNKPRRFNELLQELPGVSQTTLTKHLKNLEDTGIVERFFDKTGKAIYYRIVPENKEKVSAHEKRSEAVRRINGILNPVHSEKQVDNKHIALFCSVPANRRRTDIQAVADEIVTKSKTAIRLLNFGVLSGQKTAVLITVDSEQSEKKE
jgi:DNA-binding HxlR family transcriptional regulator